jgi:plasmid stabilization system protein ParE
VTSSPHRVTVAEAAEDDIFEIVDYILVRERDLAPAIAVQERIGDAIASLETVANRGRTPPELREVGIEEIGIDIREIIEWPWRIVYRISGRNVHVVLVLDGRRDAGALVHERALRSKQSP